MEKDNPEIAARTERDEILRALSELEGWFDERMTTLKDLHTYIQHGLQSGRISGRKKEATSKNYLTPRMIATLVVDRNQMSRVLMSMDLRRKQLDRRLHELNSLLEKKTDDENGSELKKTA
ncbi:MAG: hypothetical protein ACO3A4_14435 [Silvanigrellaceae bacterium]